MDQCGHSSACFLVRPQPLEIRRVCTFAFQRPGRGHPGSTKAVRAALNGCEMETESSPDCRGRSLLAPPRRQITSILQDTVFWLTTFLYPLRLGESFAFGNESRSVFSLNCCKRWDASDKLLTDGAQLRHLVLLGTVIGAFTRLFFS